MQMPILTQTYHKSFGKLTPPEQRAADLTAMQFSRDPKLPGLNYEKLNLREKRFRSIRVNRDIRIIVFVEDERRVLMYVDHHDDAYNWAKGRHLERNLITGSTQIVEFEEVVREIIVEIEVERRVEMPALFGGEDEGYLLSLGIPPVYIRSVKQVSTDEQLETICERLPEEASEALYKLHLGERPNPLPIAAPDADPYQTPDARRRFWVAASEEELQRALESPWASWAVFLHPSQRDAVTRDWSGPARIIGAAGTGKSVVAIHRIAELARRSQAGKLLLTTFSEALSYRLSEGMDVMLGKSGPLRERVTAEHLHGYARTVLERAGERVALLDDDLVRDWIAELRSDLDPAWDTAFMYSEWKSVVDYWGLRSFASYRAVRRTGRGKALSHRDRETLWAVFEAILTRMADEGLMSEGDLCERAADYLTGQGLFPFRYVAVDEAQDFGPRELRFVRALAPEGPHSLFFVADAGQRIARWPFAWSDVGIDVRGRGRRLTVNYRTTQQIRRFADRILPDRIETPDGVEERVTVSLLTGPEPEIVPCEDVAAERVALTRWIGHPRDQGMAPGEIALLARTQAVLERSARPVLRALGLDEATLTEAAGPQAVSVGDFEGAKGLEFRAVAALGCEEGCVPLPAALDAEHGEEARTIARERERHMLYVACTRARESMLITHIGPSSPDLPEPRG